MQHYENMVRANKIKSSKKADKATRAIREMLENDEEVTVSKLTKETNLSRAFFYNNEMVHTELERARRLQDGRMFSREKKQVLDKAMDAEIKLLRKKIADLENENAKLKNAMKIETIKTIAEL